MKNNQLQKNMSNGWQQAKLGDFLSKIEGGGTPSKETASFWSGYIPWASVKDIVTHNPYDTKDHISAEGLKSSSSRLIVAGTLIVPTRMALGHAVTFDVDVAINQDLKALYPKKELSNDFLFYWFKSKKQFIERLGSGSTVSGIQQNELKAIKFCLPPLVVQNRIIAILKAWDKAIEKLAKKIELKKNIKKGLMQQLLTGKIRLAGFDGNWRKLTFGNLALPSVKRIDPKRTNYQDYCVELENIESGTGRLLSNTFTSNSSSLKTVFGPKDVLFGKLRAYLRKYWFADKSGVCSTEIWVLRANRNLILPEILFQLIQMDNFIEIASAGQGTHMPRSSWSLVSGYVITLPDIEEQKVVASVLITADKSITSLNSKLNILKRQKKYLLNNLITGKIRTPENLKIDSVSSTE